jgi:hypothetical protein
MLILYRLDDSCPNLSNAAIEQFPNKLFESFNVQFTYCNNSVLFVFPVIAKQLWNCWDVALFPYKTNIVTNMAITVNALRIYIAFLFGIQDHPDTKE